MTTLSLILPSPGRFDLTIRPIGEYDCSNLTGNLRNVQWTRKSGLTEEVGVIVGRKDKEKVHL